MPNVPRVPGVPPLASYLAQTITLMRFDVAQAVLALLGFPQWGVFIDGVQALPYRSIGSFEYKRDWPIADYPVEQGGFQSYDKVEMPFDVRVRLTSGPSQAERQALLDAIEPMAGSLDLFDVVTPERTYVDCNVTHYDYVRRADRGAGVIMLDVWFTEIRQTAASTFNDTREPTSRGQQSLGNVTAVEPGSGGSSNPLRITVTPQQVQ